jgi:hypothetical protein
MRRLSWVLAGLGLLVAALIIIMASPQAKAWQVGDVYSGSGDWTINNPTAVGAETVAVAGNLTINSQLTLYGATIQINSGTTDGSKTVNVASGGTLNIWGASALTASNGAYHYKFTVYGILDVNGSTVSEMWGDNSSWVGGIQVYSNGVTIRNNSNITLGETGGIYVLNRAVSVLNSNVYNNGGSGSTSYCYGIYISSDGSTSSVINGCLVYNNNYISGSFYYGYGIYSAGLTSADMITNTRIWNNGGGASVYNYGTQLYLSASSPTMVNLYLGNGTYGLYATESRPPTMVTVNINSYTYNAATYAVWAYNSSLKFQGCSFTTTYISSTQYGVWANGPSTDSGSSLDFTLCNFTYTQTGAYPRYNIYSNSGYTPINITTCVFQDTSGTTVYCVYSTNYSPINVVTSTFTVSTTTLNTYGIYGSNFCPISIRNTIITMTNIGQNLASSSAYMIYGATNSPVNVTNSILTESLTGVSSYSYPYYYMIYTSSNSPVQVAASTMNMASTMTSGYPYYPYYYHIYTTSYCPVTISDSWLNFTSTALPYYAYTYTVYAQSYSPVVVTNTNIRTTITSTQTGNYIYLYQIFTSSYSPIQLMNSNMTVTVTSSSAPYTYVRQLYTQSYGQISIDYSNLQITGTFTGTYLYIYQIYLNNYCPLYINYSIMNITGTASNNYPYFYQVTASTYCPTYVRNSVVAMAETHTNNYGYHYGFSSSTYSPILIDNSIFNFQPRSTATTSSYYAYHYPFYMQSYCNLVVNFSTLNYIPYSSVYYTYSYYAYPLTYSKVWLNNSFINFAPQCGVYYYYCYGFGYAGSSNYAAIDVNWCRVNLTFPSTAVNPYYFYFYYIFAVYSSSGQNSHVNITNTDINMSGYNLPYSYAYPYYIIYSYYYSPINMINVNLNISVTVTSSSGYLYMYYFCYGYQYCPLTLINFTCNFFSTTSYYIYNYMMFQLYYMYGQNYIENVTFNYDQTTQYAYNYYNFYLYYYAYPQNYVNNVTWNAKIKGSLGATMYYPLMLYYAYGYNNVTNITYNIDCNSSGGQAQFYYPIYAYYYYSLDANNITCNVNLWAGSYGYFYGIYTAYVVANITNFTLNLQGYSAANYFYVYYVLIIQYSNMFNRLDNWTVNINVVENSGYLYLYYPFYFTSNSPTNMSNMKVNVYAATLSPTSQYLYVSYFFYATSNCPVNVRNSVFNVSVASWQPYVTMSYATTNSQLSFDDCTINISVNAYVQTSGSYLYTMRGMSSSNLQFNRTRISVTNTTVTNYYGIRGETGSAVIFNGSVYSVTNLITPQSSYHIYGAGVTWVGSTFSVINETGNISITQAKVLYYFYLLDGSSYITDANFVFDVQSRGYACQYYCFWVQGSGTPRAFVMRNTNVTVNTNNAIMGGWLLWVQTFNDVSISGCNFNVVQLAPTGSLFACQGDGGGRNFGLDNSTVDYKCLATQDSPGGYIWGFMSYTRLFVNNSIINVHNDVGMFPLYIFTGFNFGSAYFYNTNIEYSLGGGTRTVPTDVTLANNLGYLVSFDFIRSNLNVTVQNDPVNLKGFSFFNGVSGALNFDRSSLKWDINAPGSTLSVVSFENNIGEPPALQSFRCTNTAMTMTISRENGTLNMLRMASGSQMQGFQVANSQLTFTMTMSSVQTSNIIYMDGVKSGTYQNLAVTVNAPADTTTRFVGIMMTRSFPTFDNFIFKTNRQGRIIDIWADMASMPVITNTSLDYGDTGIMSTVFANPTVSFSSITNFKTGIMVDNYGNLTLLSTSISSVDTAVALTNHSYATMYDSSLNPTTTAIDMNQGSTSWLLNTTYAGKPIQFRDSSSWLIVNWWLTLKVAWNSGDVIPNALVVMNDANSKEYLRATTNADGVIPQFTVVQFTQTGAGGTTRKDFSPYSVSVKFGDFTGSLPSLVTDKSQTVTIYVTDNVAPVLDLILPENDLIRNFTMVELAGLASDVGAGIGLLNYSYILGTTEHVVASVKASPVWTYTMELPEGDNITIKVTLCDVAGNEVYDTRSITIDLTPPSITIDSPADRSLGNVINQELKGSIATDSVIFTINYRPIETDEQGKFTHAVHLVEGSNSYFFFAKDRAGNTNTASLTVFLDITPPPVTIITPVDGLLTNRSTASVTGFTEPGAQLSVNGAPVDVWLDGSFSAEVTLQRGLNTITVLASDAAGNQMRTVRTVLMDNELELNVLNPTENFATNQIALLVRGTTDPDSILRLNDAAVSIALDGNFTVTYTLAEGMNELVFSGVDRAGNTAQAVRHVLLDTTLPWIDLTSPETGKIFRTREMTVKGTCEAGINLTVNGQGVATDTGSFSLGLTNVPEGTSVITVTGSDAAGNTVTIQRQVLVDSSAPTIEIVEPLDGFRTQDRTVTVVGITEPGAMVLVNGMAVTVDEFGKFATSVTLRSGKNTITIKATDAAGNVAPDTAVSVRSVTPEASGTASMSWLWTVVGVLVALGLGFPLTMLYLKMGLGARRREG